MLRFRDLLRDGLTYPQAAGIFADYCEDRGLGHAADYWRIRQQLTTPRGDGPWVAGALATVYGSSRVYLTYPNRIVTVRLEDAEILWEETIPGISLWDGRGVITEEYLMVLHWDEWEPVSQGDAFAIAYREGAQGYSLTLWLEEEVLQPLGEPRGILQAYVLDEEEKEFVVLTAEGEVLLLSDQEKRSVVQGVSYLRIDADGDLVIHRGVDLQGECWTW
jgi:hypothetical protein